MKNGLLSTPACILEDLRVSADCDLVTLTAEVEAEAADFRPAVRVGSDLDDLTAAMKKQPKFIRTVRHNKHPILMNPSYYEKFDEYKMIGVNKLSERANVVRKNKKFAEKVELILRDEAQEKIETTSQEDLC